ncbi:unnamed protein product [Ranitomeya imitator]|uniref:ZP domain-containing protein n=1 Tax=Ranitomeya imitator TaxID=111125 RepID=A0ABN9LZ93_9NEOB|nr:unnamed protein product [Ranitomeya imitator]
MYFQSIKENWFPETKQLESVSAYVELYCHPNYMRLRISPWYLLSLGYSTNNIFLNDPQCRPQVVANWLEFYIPYEGCLTVRQMDLYDLGKCWPTSCHFAKSMRKQLTKNVTSWQMCSKVPDYSRYQSPSKNIVRFGFKAFTFLKKHSNVYIQCKLVVCKEGSANSRCRQGCIRRRKRAANAYHHEEINVMAGPLQLQNA